MKTLETIFFVCLMSLTGCIDNDFREDPVTERHDKITDLPTDISLPRNEGVRYRLTFNASDSWEIYPYEAESSYINLSESDKIRILNPDYNMVRLADWCTISPTEGEAGMAEAMVTLAANDGPSEREAKFVVEAGGDKVIFTVVQTTADKSQMPEYDDSYETPQEPDDPQNPSDPEAPDDPHDPDDPQNPTDPEPPAEPRISFDDPEFARLCLQCYDTDGDGGISEDEIAGVTCLDDAFSGIKAERLSDLRHFPSLVSLTLTSASTVKSVELGYDNKIERVCVSGSVVERMDLAGCGGIKEIVCDDALSLRTMTLPAAMPSLSVLELENATVEELTVSGAPLLKEIGHIGTLDNIRSLTLDNVGAETLTLSGTSVESVALSRMPNLGSVDLSENSRLGQLTITDAGALSSLSFAGCAIEQIDLAGAPELVSLCCDRNPLQSLDISRNRNVRTVSAAGVPDANGKGKLNIYVAFDAEDPEIIPHEDDRIKLRIKN